MSEPRGRRIRITHIHERDAYYDEKEKYIGLEGEFFPNKQHWHKGYYVGYLHLDDGKRYFFIGIRYIKI